MQIVISFDDGLTSDIRAAKLLHKYGFKATFYITSAQIRGTSQLSLKEIKDGILAYGHELGGHTVSHPMDIKLLPPDKLKFEIENNKLMIEMLLEKKPITKFCYPRGRHNEEVHAAVKAAGYKEARTTIVMETCNYSQDPFRTPTSVHMFPREEYKGRHWLEVGKELFMKAKNSPVRIPEQFFSLWGHTNELDRNDDWGNFEALLAFMNENK